MPVEGFASVTVSDEVVRIIDKIRRRDPHDPSRAKIVEAAVKSYAERQAVPA